MQNVMTNNVRLVVMAFVNGLQLHPHWHIVGHPVELWSYNLYMSHLAQHLSFLCNACCLYVVHATVMMKHCLQQYYFITNY